MTQHTDGHLWLSTKDGIARFDGMRFKTFRDGKATRGEVRQLFFLNDSILVLWHDTHQMFVFNLRSERFSELVLEYKGQPIRPGYSLAGNNGKRFILRLFDEAGNLNENVVLQWQGDSILTLPDIHVDIEQLGNWILWFPCRKFQSHWFYNGTEQLICATSLRSDEYRLDSGGEWAPLIPFYSSDDDLLAFDQTSNTLYELTDTLRAIRNLPPLKAVQKQVTRIEMDRGGTIYAMTDRQRLWALFPGETDWTFIREFNFAHMFIDREDNLYILDEGGLYVYNSFAFEHYSPETGDIPRYVWSILDDDHGSTWLGSYGHGLWQWNNGTLIDHTDLVPKAGGWLPLKQVYMGAIKHSSGSLLFSANGDLYSIDPVSLQTDSLTKNNIILYCYQDRNGKRTYAGGTKGVHVLDEQLKPMEKLDDPAIFTKPIVSIGKDNDGNLWFGSYKNAIRYDGCNFDSGFKDEAGLDISAICMETDSAGTFWVGGMNGLRYMRNDTFRVLRPALFQKQVNTLISIDDTLLLAGMREGVILINTGRLWRGSPDFYHFFGPAEGFTGIECGQNGAFLRKDGTVWMLTTDMVTLVHPTRLYSLIDPKLGLFFDAMEMTMKDSVRSVSFGQPSHKFHLDEELPYNIQRLRIRFHTVAATAPEEVIYRYRITHNGQPTEWNSSQPERYLDLTELAHGHYLIEVQSWHGNQRPPDQPITAQLTFCITTPFYLTWWFILIMATFAASTISYLTVLVVRRKRRSTELQHRLDMELNDLKYKALRAQVEPHFAANLLNSVTAAVLREDKEKASRILGAFSRMIRDILKQNDRRLHSLNEELELIARYVELERHILGDKLRYTNHIGTSVSLEQLIPVMLIHTFVENAVKHAIRVNPDGGEVHIYIDNNHAGTTIHIADTGKGIGTFGQHPQSTRKGISLLGNIVDIYNRYNHRKLKVQINDRNDGRTVSIFIPRGFTFEIPQTLTP